MKKESLHLKYLDYRNFCEVKDFKEYKKGKLRENSLYVVIPPEKNNLTLPVFTPQEKIHLPNFCSTNEIYLASIKDGLCLKNQVIIYDNKYILPDSFRHYQYISPHKGLRFNEVSNKFTTKERISETNYQPGDSIFLSGEISQGYGHFLLEVVSRLWITQYMDISRYKFIMNPNDNKRWQLDILKSLGISKKQILFLNEPIRCERLHIPVQAFVLRKYTSSYAYNIWTKIGEYYNRSVGPKKIYVSRSKLNNKRRQLVNEKEVEKIFASFGFRIVHPQELSVGQQINLFKNANIIAGPSGSGMYNSVFQRKSRRKLVLTTRNFVKMSDILINTSTSGQLNYFFGETIENHKSIHEAKWRINIYKLRKFLKCYL
ncbi:DUF563 domain-containing protein [Evansella sp. AB-rgal1]|uniref:glycosyltransferase family 61 protein n=1 Tax=Evansella sp. AB-rgal1 TaxID=3242696 RepID=UPI00359CF2AB